MLKNTFIYLYKCTLHRVNTFYENTSMPIPYLLLPNKMSEKSKSAGSCADSKC